MKKKNYRSTANENGPLKQLIGAIKAGKIQIYEHIFRNFIYVFMSLIRRNGFATFE